MALPTTKDVDESLLQAFSLVCAKLYAEDLVPTSIPADGTRVRSLFSPALAPYGECLGVVTNLETLLDQYFPPLVALVVQPNDASKVWDEPSDSPNLCQTV